MKRANFLKSLLVVIFTFCLSENVLNASSKGFSPTANPALSEGDSRFFIDLTKEKDAPEKVTEADLKSLSAAVIGVKNMCNEVFLVIGDMGAACSRFVGPWVFLDPACSPSEGTGKVNIRGTVADLCRVLEKYSGVHLEFNYVVDDIACIADRQSYADFHKTSIPFSQVANGLSRIMADGALLSTKRSAFLTTSFQNIEELYGVFDVKQGPQTLNFAKPGLDGAGTGNRNDEHSAPVLNWTPPQGSQLRDLFPSELNFWLASTEKGLKMNGVIFDVLETLNASLVRLCAAARPECLKVLDLLQSTFPAADQDVDELRTQLGNFRAWLTDVEDVLTNVDARPGVFAPSFNVSALQTQVPGSFADWQCASSQILTLGSSQDSVLTNKLQNVLTEVPCAVNEGLAKLCHDIIFTFDTYKTYVIEHFSTEQDSFMPRSLLEETMFLQKKSTSAE
jgi:hypothetical protein